MNKAKSQLHSTIDSRYQDRKGVATLVTAIVGHPVACAIVMDGSFVGKKKGVPYYFIQPLEGWAMRDFWLDSDYSKTDQYKESPIDAGIHYARHYIDFVIPPNSPITRSQIADLFIARYTVFAASSTGA